MNGSAILNSVKEYIGMFTVPVSDIGSILMSVTEKYSKDVYLDEKELKEAMREFGANDVQAAKVFLMTQVTGFQELLEQDIRIQQNDIDRYMLNAGKELGFHRIQILELTSAVAMSLGMPFGYEIGEAKEIWKGAAFVIPAQVYEDELRKIEESEQEELSPEDLTRLETLASAGIPKAKYYLGCYLLKKEEFEQNRSLGLQMLEEAASEGDSSASGALGDYYYELGFPDSWQRAYEYYTGYGALALNEKRREAVLNMINHRIFNRKMLAASTALAFSDLAALIFVPGAAVFAAHRAVGSICFIGIIAILAAAVAHYRIKPYDSVYWVPCCMFLVWSLYIAVRIFF